MAKYSFVVLSNPTPGNEAEYNRWYNEQHLPDVLAVPGFVAAQRFRRDDPDSQLKYSYMAIYEIESDDVAKTMADLNGRAGTPAMQLSDAIDLAGVSTTLFSPVTGRVLPSK